MNERIFTDLSPEQADGRSCVWCGTDYLTVDVPHVPVGFSDAGGQVFACVGACHGHAQALWIFEQKGLLAGLPELRRALEAERAARRRQQP